jgi:hypothetical protein
MRPANVPFTEADLASHVLRMCPHAWQDQYNLHKKGMTPVDMRSLLTSLEAIEHVFTQKKSNMQSGKKGSVKNETGTKQPSTGSTNMVPKKVSFEKHCKLCKKHGSAHTTHTTKDCHKYEKEGLMKANFRTAKKAGKEPNHAKQTFSQLSENLDKLEKFSRRGLLSPRNATGTIAILTLNRELG